MTSPQRVFLLDMDGVVVDSNPHHRLAWEAFNRRYGLETTEAMHHRMYGRRNDQIVRDFFGDDLSAEELAARGLAKEAIYREIIAGQVEAMLAPGLREFLGRYHDVPKALASNAEPANVDFVLERAALRPYFQVILNGNQVSRPKPDPEIYLRAAALLGAEPPACIVFEDSYSGVEAGRQAGMKVVGFRTTHDYLPGTEITVDNFRSEALEAWLSAEIPAER